MSLKERKTVRSESWDSKPSLSMEMGLELFECSPLVMENKQSDFQIADGASEREGEKKEREVRKKLKWEDTM